MEEDTNDTVVEEVVEDITLEEDLTPETDWEAEAKKARGIAQRLRTKLTKATEKKVDEPKAEPVKDVQKTGELDDAVLDFFDLKGYDEDQIQVFTQIMKKTGMSHRDVIKDDYALAKVGAIKQEKETRAAMPSDKKRSGQGSVDSIDAAVSKYEKTGEMPEDFALRTAVVEAITSRNDVHKPLWQR